MFKFLKSLIPTLNTGIFFPDKKNNKTMEVETMGKTKNQISNEIYGLDFEDLTGGQKSAVSREFNSDATYEDDIDDSYEEGDEDLAPTTASTPGTVSVKFGRPGVNGVSEALVQKGTNVGDALKQANFQLNESKEGILKKSTGASVMLTHPAEDGETYMIVPGVDSSL